MIKVDKERAIAELHKAVETKGTNHIAEACIISSCGEPVCIVGQVFYQIVGPEVFAELNPTGQVDTPAMVLGIELTEGAREVLRAAQRYQDGKVGPTADMKPWGAAVDYALTQA